jgi:asparagine synthase (glutamine-hydrolysing)
MNNYRRVVHRLSGGLDSAVVLDALLQSSSRPLLFCENHYADCAPEGDERTYARLIAQTLGAPLREIAFPRTDSNLNRLENLPITARPSASLLSFQHEFILTLALEHGIDTFTNGHGGDQVFCNYSGPLLAADYAIENGIDAGLIDLVRGIAGNGRHSLWKILAAIVKYAYAGIRDDPMLRHRDVNNPLTDEASESVTLDYITPPWMSQCRGLPPAKLMHVLMIADLQVYNETSIENLVADTPTLLAVQPIVEICLQTPTHILGRHGADRAIERAAFAARLPSAIVNRHVKGDTTRYFANLLLANLQWLRPFLLDGSLPKSGLVCRNKLEGLLTMDSLVRGKCFGALISCLLAEAWIGAARRLVSPANV